MKIGIIGLPQAGKTTIFKALTGQFSVHEDHSGLWKQAVVKVPDKRLLLLQEMFSSSKIIPAHIEYLDVALDLREHQGRKKELEKLLDVFKPVDALILVVRNFSLGGIEPSPQEDLDSIHEEMILSDLLIVERRIERLEKEVKKGRQPKEKELDLFYEARKLLEQGLPLRENREIRQNPLIRGFAFLTIKPLLIVINSEEERNAPSLTLPPQSEVIEIKGLWEAELTELSEEEAQLFRKEIGLNEPALSLFIRKSFEILDMICFFTGNEKEARAWPLKKGTSAQKAGGVIHSDIERGFIRAEVIPVEELVKFSSYKEAQRAGKIRLEGKEYIIQDGDYVLFRFKV